MGEIFIRWSGLENVKGIAINGTETFFGRRRAREKSDCSVDKIGEEREIIDVNEE